jgi:protein TonB
MYGPNTTLYNGYGAFALKARYQQNLMLSQLLVIGMISVALVLSVLWPRDRVISIRIEPQRPDSIIVRIDRPPTIVRTDPTTGPRKPPDEIRSFIIPDPVPDDEAVDTSIFSRDDLRGMYGADSPGLDDGGIDSIDTSRSEYIPESNEFIICEIPPEMIKSVSPDYPELAKKAGLEGNVTIRALLDTSGIVRKVLIAKSSEVAMLDAAAERAAWKCRYKPGIQSGRPIWVWVTYSVAFKLSE